MNFSSRCGKRALLALSAAVFLSGCAGQASPAERGIGDQTGGRAPKRVGVAVRGDVPTLVPSLAGPVPGLSELEDMLNPGLVTFGAQTELVPVLAEAVPTTENGLWRVFPDGRMETTWKLRANLRWHDGAPFTAHDFAFRDRVYRDERMPFFGGSIYQSMERLEAADDRTLVVHWKRIHLQADEGVSFPFPRHILEPVHQAGDPERFLAHNYWTDEFVGVGAYKLRQWNRGSGVVLDAFADYTLGRPKIDVIEAKFIVDPNTIAANILAGEIDVTLGGRLPLDWAEQLKEQAAGRAGFGTQSANPMVVYINTHTPTPTALLDVQFRKALVHALDRASMMDTLVSGLTAVVHATVLNPSREEEYRALERHQVRYDYDPRRAAELIEGLGHRKGPDGLYRDPTGTQLVLEIRTTQGDIQQERSMFATADNWQRVGLASEPVVVASARRGDDQYRATFPGFDLRRNPHRPDTMRTYLHGSQAPLPERNYRGNNYGRYLNPELDAIIDLHDRTIPRQERWDILGRAVNFVTDQVVVFGLFYDVEVTVTSSRMRNVLTRAAQRGEAWNVHAWDVA